MNRDCKALNAEVERLTKENAELKASGRQALDAGEETIERLTKELADALQRGVVLAIKSEKNEHRALEAKFTANELKLLREAVRIAAEDGSLSGFASEKAIDRLAEKIACAALPATPEPQT
jgi:methylase of polypeptide subunit release factors